MDLKQFTAEIFTPDGKKSLGAGFLISEDGLVATAFHVVEPFYNHGQPVLLRFDKATSEVKAAPARYVTRPGRAADDLILLQADLDVLELRPPAPLAAADDTSDANFRAYGFAEFGAAGAFLLNGRLLGTVRHGDSDNAADLVQMECRLAEKGMSGAAVWDLTREAVVGLITSRPKKADLLIAHAVDARLLVDYLARHNKTPSAPKRAALRDDFAGRRWRLSPALADRMAEAPQIFDEYVERRWMKRDFAEDLADPAARVLSVVAIGGQGKTTFTRRRLDDLAPRPQARFWWPCYTVAEPDKLLAALYDWLSAGADNGVPPGGQERAAAVISLLNQADVVAVIDGFEVMQHGPGDRYGEVKDGDLRALLVGLSRSAGKGKLVISSRFPLADLAAEPAHRAHPLDRLDDGDGVRLLRQYGVSGGRDPELAALNQRWDGHALTLSLIAGHIRSHCAGDPAKAEGIALADGDQYEKLRRVMARYDRDLAEPERRYLLLLAAFRRAPPPEALTRIIAASGATDDICAPLRGVDLAAVRDRLAGLGLLRGGEATPHPLVQEYFQDKLAQAAETPRRRLHRRIADYYQLVATPLAQYPVLPKLDDLSSWIEMVLHLAKSMEFESAFDKYAEFIEQDPYFVLNKIGEIKLRIEILSNFINDNNTVKLNNSRDALICLAWYGKSLEYVGDLRKAIDIQSHNTNTSYQMNLTDEYNFIVIEKIRLQIMMGNGNSIDNIIWILLDRLNYNSIEKFQKTEKWILFQILDAAIFTDKYDLMCALYSILNEEGTLYDEIYLTEEQSIIPYVEYCRRNNIYNNFAPVLKNKICESIRKEIIGHRTLGDFSFIISEKRQHYDAAVTAARKTTNRLALIGVLNARGRFLARHGEIDRARSDLEEAFQYALDAEHKLEEVNARVGLAWLYQAEGRLDKARTMARKALKMSDDINYPWGRDDAGEVLAALG